MHDFVCCGACARARHVHAGVLCFRDIASDVEIDTPINFHEWNSMANDNGGGVHRARAHVQGTFVVKTSPLL